MNVESQCATHTIKRHHELKKVASSICLLDNFIIKNNYNGRHTTSLKWNHCRHMENKSVTGFLIIANE